MKKNIRNTVKNILKNDKAWELFPSLLKNQDFFRIQRNVGIEERFAQRCSDLFNDRVVLNGPFTGLNFPCLETQGSAALPRLIGSYESELHDTFKAVLNKRYSSVIDIGFAEGYYLVGLASKLLNTKFIGFDLSSEAHRLCSQLAVANNIPQERLLLLGECSIDSLNNFLPSSSLVICDCEGFEMNLFTLQSKSLWQSSDIIVECHDFITPGIQESIHSLLRDTHKISTIQTVSNENKLSFLDSPKFEAFSKEEKLRLVNEGRPSSQTWIVAESI
jgi:hypothetical protein